MTFLSRLVEKGYLSCEKNGKSNFYEPIVSYEEFSRRESKHILDKLYRNSLKNFVVSLYDGDELSRQDVKELREFWMRSVQIRGGVICQRVLSELRNPKMQRNF